ncbi:hypothetical protein GCM10023350_05690 [Nocardioides endophyticus]|uniref:Acyl-CoA oxidase/dehydrogenase middle domain-containing protein n=1 Tax=Nocardioides endophyticus TaxID=1353775 RepID=A0ABP8YE78_9ACTN
MSSDFYAGSDAANQKTTAEGDGDFWVLNGVKRWITNAGVSEFYTVLTMTDASKRTRGITAFVVEKPDEGLFFGAPEKKIGIKGSPTRRSPAMSDAMHHATSTLNRGVSVVRDHGSGATTSANHQWRL